MQVGHALAGVLSAVADDPVAVLQPFRGGDFANDRILPDCLRAVMQGKPVGVRNPYSTRPYQHVLEPLFVYLMIAAMQFEDPKYAGYYNVGPDDKDCVNTGELVELFCSFWKEDAAWKNENAGGPHEANFLKLDCSRLKSVFGWRPVWDVSKAVEKTVEWNKAWLTKQELHDVMERQIREFLADAAVTGQEKRRCSDV